MIVFLKFFLEFNQILAIGQSAKSFLLTILSQPSETSELSHYQCLNHFYCNEYFEAPKLSRFVCAFVVSECVW